MKWKQWIFGMVLALLVPATAFAGDINAEEQTVLAVACGTFEYKGVVYQATPQRMAEARAKLMQDDVDLTPEQAKEAIANIYANVQTGIEEGYIVPVSGEGTMGESKGTSTEGDSSEGAKNQISSSDNRTGSSGEKGTASGIDNAGRNETTAGAESGNAEGQETSAATGDSQNNGTSETTEGDNSQSAPEETKTPEQILWEKIELPKLLVQRQQMDVIEQNHIDIEEADGTEALEIESMLETELKLTDIGLGLSGIWILSVLFLIGITVKRKKRARNIFSLIETFLLTVILTIMMLAAGFRLGICNKAIFIQTMTDTVQYEDLYKDMDNQLKFLLWEAELPIELAEEVFQESQIYIDGKNYISAALDGKEPTVKTDKIEKKLRQNIETYLYEKNQNLSKWEPEIEKIRKTTVLEYKQKTASPLADSFYQFQSRYAKVADLIMITGVILCLIILFFLLKMYHRKYKAICYVLYAVTISTIANTLYTWHLTKVLTVGNGMSESGNYYQITNAFFEEAGVQGYYISMVGAVVTAALLLLIQTMKKKGRH